MGRDPRLTPQARDAELRARLADDRASSSKPSDGLYHEQGGGLPRLAEAMASLLLRDDGWLRITPQEDGKTVYFKWKWTRGKHVNHYVMTVYPASQCSDAMRRLALKVHAVDCGEETPVKDHYFKG